MNNSNGKHSSLSDTVENPYDFLKLGYIHALEFHKHNIEGIILDNLKDFDFVYGLISGSDCHQWEVYPKHDKNENILNKKFYTTIKALPTFKGLLLALTSPSTRFRRKENENANYLKEIKINNKVHQISGGINAIIGENGSGKSTLISGIVNKCENYQKKIIKDNNIIFDKQINNQKQNMLNNLKLLRILIKKVIFLGVIIYISLLITQIL